LDEGTSLSWGRQRDRGFRRQQPEGETLLQIQFDLSPGMAEVSDGQVLAEIELEISPPRGKHETAINTGRPDDLAFHKTLDVLKNRIAFFAPAADSGKRVVPSTSR
jgi:hypothetical protein